MLVLPFCAVPLFIVCVCVMCRMYYYAHVHVFSALFVCVCVGPSGFVRSRAIGWLVVIGRGGIRCAGGAACLSVCYSNAFVRCVSCVDVALRGATITVLLCPEVSRGCLVTY